MAIDPTAPMGFVSRCKVFFGFREGQNLSEFSKEVKELSDKDKLELVDLFNKAGMPTLAPGQAQAPAA